MTTRGAVRTTALAFVFLLALFGPPAGAQQSRSYAVMSLVADKIYLVQPQSTTGSSLDRNNRQAFDVADEELEIIAVSAAEAAIKKEEPQAPVDLYVTSDRKIYGLLGAEESDISDVPLLLSQLKPLLADTKASHLLLVTRHRQPARFALSDGMIGVGKVYGVGFYVHEGLQLRRVDSGERQNGFVGPYAALKVQLFDLSAKRLVSEAAVLASNVHAAPIAAESAWKAMSVDDKMNALKLELQRAVRDGVTRVMH